MSAETFLQILGILVPVVIAIIAAVKVMLDNNNKVILAKHAENIKAIDARNAEALKAFELKAEQQTAEAARLAVIAATAAEQVRLQGEQKKAELGLLADMVKSIREMNTNRAEENKATTAERIANAGKLDENTKTMKANTAALVSQTAGLDTSQQKVDALSQAVAADGSATRAKLDQTNDALRDIETSLKSAIASIGGLPTEVTSALGAEFQGIRTALETVCNDFSRMASKKNGGTVQPAEPVAAADTTATEPPTVKITGVIEGIIETKGDNAL